MRHNASQMWVNVKQMSMIPFFFSFSKIICKSINYYQWHVWCTYHLFQIIKHHFPVMPDDKILKKARRKLKILLALMKNWCSINLANVFCSYECIYVCNVTQCAVSLCISTNSLFVFFLFLSIQVVKGWN